MIAATLHALGCSSDAASPRAQLLVIVDTDAPAVGQLVDDPELAPSSAVDTVRVDVLDDDGRVADHRELSAIDRRSWPVSFGAAPGSAAQRSLTLRVRVFRSVLASPGRVGDEPVLDPFEETALDRLVVLDFPPGGVRTARVVLHADCIGVPISLLDATTCIDRETPSGSARAGVELDVPDPESSQVGTWAGAVAFPCTAPAVAGALCIPGGTTILGDRTLVGLSPQQTAPSPAPLKAVAISPFYLDETEFTVGRYRRLVKSPKQALPTLATPSDPLLKFCTFRGKSVSTADAMPLNCVSPAAAAEACALAGGSLPTEAEWEYAARGRGERRAYPWGDDAAACCTASLGRRSTPDIPAQCGSAGAGPEPAGSHASTTTCASADISRDGVLDLGGSLSEWVRGGAAAYDDPCWGVGLARDVVCPLRPGAPSPIRGSDWTAGTTTALSALRGVAIGATVTTGFRCKYPGVAP